MSILEMLSSGKTGVVAQAICFCVARGNPTSEEIAAIQDLENAPNSDERIAGRPLSALLRAAIHVIKNIPYAGTDVDVSDMIVMLTDEENLKNMRETPEYKKLC